MKAVLAAPITALSLFCGASPAAASADNNSDYLQQVQEKLPDIYNEYGPQAILNEGYRVCGYGALRMDLTPEVDRIVMDMPMSRHSAIQIKTDAEIYLDCVPD